MRVSESRAPSERLTQFRRLEPGLQTTVPESSFVADQRFHLVANSLAELLETARRELERDRELAKASLTTASRILRVEIERCSVANGCPTGGLVGWQVARVQAYINSNLHRTIHIRDLSSVARRSPSHFCRSFKSAFGETPHAEAWLAGELLEIAGAKIRAAQQRQLNDKRAGIIRISYPRKHHVRQL